jgi:hypothetical protein
MHMCQLVYVNLSLCSYVMNVRTDYNEILTLPVVTGLWLTEPREMQQKM